MPPPPRSAELTIAGGGALLLLAAHVAARAARDALFLTQFPVTSLPQMVIVASLVSLASAALLGLLLARHGPDRVVPATFAASGALYLVDWLLVVSAPPIGAVALFLHLAATGGVLISCFWSLVNERFDPRTGKAAVARIGGFAALGGALGGLAAHGLAPSLGVPGLLWMLAALHVACAVCTTGMAALGPPMLARREPDAPGAAGARALLRHRLLLPMAGFVAVVAASEVLLDYALKAEASARFGGEAGLVRFFALFYTASGLAAFALQAAAGQRALERLGLAGALACLPGAVVLLGLPTVAFPRLATLALTRGAATALGGSLARAAFELLYTPLAPRTRRASKTAIDVGAQRLGEMAGAGAILCLLAVVAPLPGAAAVALAVATSLVALLLVLRIQRRYVQELGESLRSAHVEPEASGDPVAERAETLGEARITLDREELRARLRELQERGEGTASPAAGADGAGRDALLAHVEALTCGEPERVQAALRDAPRDPRLVAFVLPLLARFDVGDAAQAWLAPVAERCTGQLADALLDAETPGLLRRRVPQLLAGARTARARDALVAGLADADFELRLRCSRAALAVAAAPQLSPPPAAAVLAAVARELERDPRAWERQGRRRLEAPGEVVLLEAPPPAALDRSVEHVFNLLALVHGAEMMRSALLGLYSGDANLRGTALEYLEAVVPERLWRALEPRLPAAGSPPRAPRPHDVVAEQLLRTTRGLRGAPGHDS